MTTISPRSLPSRPHAGVVPACDWRSRNACTSVASAGSMGRTKRRSPRNVFSLSAACECSYSIFPKANNFLTKSRCRVDFGPASPQQKFSAQSDSTMNVQQAIAQFLEHGQSVRNLSDRTLRAYQSDLAQFQLHMNDAPASLVTADDLEIYLDKLGGGPYRDTSIRRKVAALKVFFRFLEEQGIVNESPARKLKIKKPVENRVPTVLSSREVRALLAAPKEQVAELSASRDQSAGSRNRYFCAVRDNVILELLFSTGIRIGELVALNVSDVDLDRHQIQITGRATRGRTVALGSGDVIEAMRQYLELRNERMLSTPALFVGRSGTRLTIYSIENIFKKHVRLAEIKRHVTPHSLRHTMAALLVSSGTDIKEVQEILGHASILSTQVYTRLPIQKRRAPATQQVPRIVAASASAVGAGARIPIKK
ncbi:MAG TPA: tyrosine-type recombinase/integrase [Thermoanaerobaculia bacterium]|nr:tyrosine-type recombinase/integrase [Thermoanaerobaculia bacterium]